MSADHRYSAMFSALKQKRSGAFIPFVMLGDPDLAQSEQIIQTLIEHGADALELGLPFSDPVADGPVIQRAAQRALSANVRIRDCFALLQRIRQQHPDIPIGLLLYGNLVSANGVSQFYQQCSNAGVDSVLIADIPLRESQIYREAARQANISQVFIAPPDASSLTIQDIARYSQGYVYLLSRAGVTGSDTAATAPASGLIRALQNAGSVPAVAGFGISQPDHVRQAIHAGAAGAISGSAVVKRIEDNLLNPATMHDALAEFIQSMKAATEN